MSAGSITKDIDVSENICEVPNEAVHKTTLSTRDVEFYYYTQSAALKLYKLVKQNPHLYRSSWACDRCYTIHPAKELLYKHDTQDVILCKECHEKNKAKDRYTEIIPVLNADLGLYYTNIDDECDELPPVKRTCSVSC